jgi:RNA polymerase sigma-70 factor, ECF subfamily
MTGARRADGRDDLLPLVPGLRAYARVLTCGDRHAADDLVQDAVMLALQGWDGFTPGTNLRAWLFRILRNRHLSLRSRRHLTAEVGVDDLSLHGSVPAFQEGRAELRHFKAAFARLRPHYREVLVLHAVDGLEYKEIAAITGCAVGTVKSRIHRARGALKAELLGGEREEASAPDRDGGDGLGGSRPGTDAAVRRRGVRLPQQRA